MTQEMLREDYYVLAPLIRDNKKILLCQNIITKQYEFFTFNGYNYVKVEDEIENGLRQTFKPIASDVLFFNVSKKSLPHKDTIALQHNKAKYFIEQALKHTDPMTKIACLSKINSVTYKHFSEDNILSETLDPNQTLAYFRVSQNTVYYTDEKSLEDLHVLTHELMHCTSKSSYDQCVGFKSSFVQSHHKAPQTSVFFELGHGINEGATEFYTSKALNEPPQSYELFVNIFSNIRKACDPRFLDTYFFNNKVEYAKGHISSCFHYDNNYQIEKLIAQCDALYVIYREDIATTDPKNAQDILSLAYSCYTTLIDMYIHKYIHENINLDDKILFDDILDNFALDSYLGKQIMTQLLPRLESYFALATVFEEEKTNSEFSGQQTRSLCALVITHIAQNKPIPEKEFNESTKTLEFYHMMLTDWSCLNDDIQDFEYTANIKLKVFKYLLSPENLPQNPKLQEKIVMMVLQDDIFYDIDALKLLPPKLVVKVLRKNPKYELACFLHSPAKFLPNLVCGFSDSTKQNKEFKKAFFESLAYFDKKQAFLMLKNFYQTLSLKSPEILTEIQEAMLEYGLCEETQSQILDFIHQEEGTSQEL